MKRREKLAIGARILAARVTGTPRPFFVQYSLLNACNAKCAYCDSPGRPDPQMDTAAHLAILTEFARLGTVRVKFLGGEPLLRDDLGELVEHVHGLGMRSAIVTNGFRIPAMMDVVRRIDEVVISLDGRETVHDAQRGRGTWKRVMAGVEACHAEGVDFFLSAVVTRESVNEVDWLLEQATRLGVMVNFQIPQHNPTVYGEEARAWLPEPEAIRDVLERIIRAKESGAPVLFTSRSYRRTLAWKDAGVERTERAPGASPCTAGTYFLQMEPNGDIYPCFQHLGRFVPRNAVTDGVEAAWRHAQNHGCGDCYNTWLNENRAIFDLRPEVLGNFWSNYLRPRGRRGRVGA